MNISTKLVWWKEHSSLVYNKQNLYWHNTFPKEPLNSNGNNSSCYDKIKWYMKNKNKIKCHGSVHLGLSMCCKSVCSITMRSWDSCHFFEILKFNFLTVCYFISICFKFQSQLGDCLPFCWLQNLNSSPFNTT